MFSHFRLIFLAALFCLPALAAAAPEPVKILSARASSTFAAGPAAAAGCRVDAALMRWQAVNFNNNTISNRPFKAARTSGKLVTIPMHPQLREALFEAESRHEKSNYILPDVVERYQKNPAGIGKDISKLMNPIGLEVTIDAPENVRTKKLGKGKEKTKRRVCQYGTHSFRHSFVSFCANAGVPMAIV